MRYVWKIVLAGLFFLMISAPVYANEWRAEFDRLCGYTQEADKFSVDELKGFIADCDKLQEVMVSSADPSKKVFLFRLKKCRNFFEYMITTKEAQ